VGTNPFIMGPPAQEGNRLLQLLRGNPDIECYLLNTGRAGEGERSRDISVGTTIALLREVARGALSWQADPKFGFQLPQSVSGLEIQEYDPRRAYPAAEFDGRLEELRQERRAWLDKFPGLDEEIVQAVY